MKRQNSFLTSTIKEGPSPYEKIKTVARMFELLKEELEHFKVEVPSKVRWEKKKIQKYNMELCVCPVEK